MHSVRSRFLALLLVLAPGLPALAAKPSTAGAAKPSRTARPAPSGSSDSGAPDGASVLTDAPTRESPLVRTHRYAFVAGGALLVGGLGFGYFARGEAARARTLSSASESSIALERARSRAATANVLYGVAGATLLYGIVLELLPEPAAEKASLTFHF
jgi:hypothetical protein